MNPPRRAEPPQPRAAEPPLHRIAMNRIAVNPIGTNLPGGRAAHSRPSGLAPVADRALNSWRTGRASARRRPIAARWRPARSPCCLRPMAGLAGIAGARPPLRLGGSMLVCARQFGMRVRDRALHGSRGDRRNRLCRSRRNSARRFAGAFRLPPGDTSNGAWWRDRCGSTNDCPAGVSAFGAARQSSAARAALSDMASERGACENTGDDCGDEFRSSVWHVPLR